MKVDFSKLIGDKYPIHIKMEILNWMLETGKGIEHSYGWNCDGINKALLDYSANNFNKETCLPERTDMLNWYFDAIFARAVYAPETKPLKEWRMKERIYPTKYRMLNFQQGIPENESLNIMDLIKRIHKLKGSFLKKEHHQPDFEKRTAPKILDISIYTNGNGWKIIYNFSFKEFDYEDGWQKEYYQQKNESIWQFLSNTHKKLLNSTKEQTS